MSRNDLEGSSSTGDPQLTSQSEWQLVGYGRKKSHDDPPQPLDGQFDPPPLKMTSRTPRKKLPSNRFDLLPSTSKTPTSFPNKIMPLRDTVQSSRGRGISTARRGRGNTHRQTGRVFTDSPAKSKWRCGGKPTDSVRLPLQFGSLKFEFFAAAKARLRENRPQENYGRYDVFDIISKTTGAYVNPPSYTDHVIDLWGEPAQVASAKDIIVKLAKCTSVSTTKKPEWVKINSFSYDKEADAETKEQLNMMVMALRRPPDSLSVFSEKMLFLWPQDGPSPQQSLGPQLEDLDLIRLQLQCHLFIPKDLPNFICALGPDLDTLKEVARRIRTTWTETVARRYSKSKIYIVEPPVLSNMRPNVTLKETASIARATLTGDVIQSDALPYWRDRVALIKSRNKTRISNAIERSLRDVPVVRGHLRMRVNIGSFVLSKFRRPANGGVAYGFEEFREMLAHENARGRLIPGLKAEGHLLDKCFQAEDFLAPYGLSLSSLRTYELSYSVNFEFRGSSNSMLRLEAEFARIPGASEYEITQRRWLKPRKSGKLTEDRPILQIAVIDFERSDWQLEISSLEFYEASEVLPALKAFSHTIEFHRNPNDTDIMGKPRRKVTFPSDAPISRFVEKTALRYRLKDTRYVLEIARYDEYTCPAPSNSAALSTVPTSVFWGASIFAPQWDNLLGEQANLQVGNSARYDPNLDTFFPSKDSKLESNKGRERNSGLSEFIELVKRSAELLSPDKPSTARKNQGPQSSSTTSNLSKPQISSDSSPVNSTTDLNGIWDVDLGTLF